MKGESFRGTPSHDVPLSSSSSSSFSSSHGGVASVSPQLLTLTESITLQPNPVICLPSRPPPHTHTRVILFSLSLTGYEPFFLFSVLYFFLPFQQFFFIFFFCS
ncbi:hypothetical protein E2C01_060613 [Portunus trituberculatus]|uniref:Uncharacterized protein n=1 Tax=Portunus trituberculatus TaxID=210409 RepID=A0A5B7H9Y2_PORTR|nr:hypothetical protein [Portunus trituberculatus]